MSAKTTSQNATRSYNQKILASQESTASGTRTTTGNRQGASSSVRALTNESDGTGREIGRGNIAMQISFTVPITTKIPANPNSSSC